MPNNSAYVFSWILLLIPISTIALTSDNELPWNIKADHSIYNQQQGISHLTGHVYAKQGTTKAWGKEAVIKTDNKNQVTKLILTGSLAHYQTRPDKSKTLLTLKADKITYYPNKKQVYLYGHASAHKDGNTITGTQLWYNLDKQEVVSKSGSKQKPATVTLTPANKKPTSVPLTADKDKRSAP